MKLMGICGRLAIIVIAIAIVIANVANSWARAEYLVQVNRFTFEPEDHELIISHSARIEHDANRSYLSGHLMFSRPAGEITIFASMDMSRAKLPRVRLFDTKMELCPFFNNNYKSKFVQQFLNSYVSFINVRPRCPLQAHIKYELQRAYLDERMLPDLLPECSYFLKLAFRNKSKPLAVTQISGHIRPVVNKAATPKFRVKL